MQNAIMAIEDERFYEHDGVDVRGLLRAAYSTLTGGQVQGGSTLTQQLIKITLLMLLEILLKQSSRNSI